MREPPFVIAVDEDRFFKDDHCANCLEPLSEDLEALFCSSWCSEIAESVRYQRRVFRDGRIEQPDVQDAVRTRNAFLLIGGYKSLGRTLSPSTRARVRVRDGGRCASCGKPGIDIDHISGSSPDLDNLQLLCGDCHRAKTAENLVPASPKHVNLLNALFTTRVAPDEPTLLCDDEVEWPRIWRRLKASRRERFMDRLRNLDLDVSGLRMRAEMVLELEDCLADLADEADAPDDYEGGFGENSYFERSMRNDD